MRAKTRRNSHKWICANSHAPNTFPIWIFGVRGADEEESEEKKNTFHPHAHAHIQSESAARASPAAASIYELRVPSCHP